MGAKPIGPDIQIGSKIYYIHDTAPWTVTGETSRSWLVQPEGSSPPTPWDPAKKIAKNKLPEYWTFCEQEWADARFAKANSYRISRFVEHRATPSQIKQIAALIGYEPEENGK